MNSDCDNEKVWSQSFNQEINTLIVSRELLVLKFRNCPYLFQVGNIKSFAIVSTFNNYCMHKFFTLFICIVFCAAAAFAQTKTKTLALAKKTEAPAKIIAQPASPSKGRLVTHDFVKMVSGDPEYMKNIVMFGESFAYDFNKEDEKMAEITKMVAANNNSRSVADVITSVLPKPVFYKSNEETAAQYHAVLEQLLAENPSLGTLLGENFMKIFQDEKIFAEHVVAVLSKGYFTKF